MTETYDLTNPITDALGDEHTLREVTMTNHSTMTRIEPLTNTEIPAGQTVLVRVLGDIGHEQLISQIQQINELKGFEVIGVSSVVVDGVGEQEPANNLILTNATYGADGRITYTGGNMDTPSGNKSAFMVSVPITNPHGGLVFQPQSIPDSMYFTAILNSTPPNQVLENLGNGQFNGLMLIVYDGEVDVKVDGVASPDLVFSQTHTTQLRLEGKHFNIRVKDIVGVEPDVVTHSPDAVEDITYMHLIGFTVDVNVPIVPNESFVFHFADDSKPQA